MASAMGTARIPTQGSCRPFVTTSTGSPLRLIERPGIVILEVGFSAIVAIIGCPELIPPKIPPA